MSCSRTLTSPAASRRWLHPGRMHETVQLPHFPPCFPSLVSFCKGLLLGSLLSCSGDAGGANPDSRAAAELLKLGAFPFSFRCLLAWARLSESASPFPILHVAFPGLWPGKQERRGVRGLNCLLLDSAGGFPGAGLAHAELRGGSRCRCVWLRHGPAVPMWDASAYPVNPLLFSVFPTWVVMGKERMGVLAFSEHLRCHDNLTTETFFFQLQTKLGLPSWIRLSPADLKCTKQNCY